MDWRGLQRSKALVTFLVGTEQESTPNPITESPHMLAARLNLFGSPDVAKLLAESQEADRRAWAARALVDERAQRMRDGAEPKMSLREDSKEAERLKLEADEADRRVVDEMMVDIGRPLNTYKPELGWKRRKELEA